MLTMDIDESSPLSAPTVQYMSFPAPTVQYMSSREGSFDIAVKKELDRLVPETYSIISRTPFEPTGDQLSKRRQTVVMLDPPSRTTFGPKSDDFPWYDDFVGYSDRNLLVHLPLDRLPRPLMKMDTNYITMFERYFHSSIEDIAEQARRPNASIRQLVVAFCKSWQNESKRVWRGKQRWPHVALTIMRDSGSKYRQRDKNPMEYLAVLHFALKNQYRIPRWLIPVIDFVLVPSK